MYREDSIVDFQELLKQIQKGKDRINDLHILRFYSSYVAVSEGKVIKITDPHMAYCPLASSFYKDLDPSIKPDALKKAIIRTINSKISKFGHFTAKRELLRNDIAVPYGASEILMYALRKKIIDAAVIVCDGAGTVIVDKPEVVQGIGARMNGLFYTSPIPEVIKRLKKTHSRVVFKDAAINQIEGVKKAALSGYKHIAVTINALSDENLVRLSEMENKYKISLTSLIVCTTDVTLNRIQEIKKYADVVWSCASEKVRELIGKKAILQLSRKIPVFVLNQKGLNLISAYTASDAHIRTLSPEKQYIIAKTLKGTKIRIGNFESYLSETKLPVRDKKEPRLICR